jgi:hypothetical protein
MANVTVKVAQRPLGQEVYDPELTINFYPGQELPGVVSELSWDNSAVQDGLHRAFGKREGEVLVGVIITAKGIKGHFRKR